MVIFTVCTIQIQYSVYPAVWCACAMLFSAWKVSVHSSVGIVSSVSLCVMKCAVIM